MLSFFNSFRDINTVNIFFRMVFAVICGGVIGIERSMKNRPAGFRTHILIITGATAASLTGHYIYMILGLPTDMSRLGAQVITGLGFIGAGTIIVTGTRTVKGLTTAAGLWATGIMGLAIGAGFYEGALIGTIAILFTEIVLGKIKVKRVKGFRCVDWTMSFASAKTAVSLSRHSRSRARGTNPAPMSTQPLSLFSPRRKSSTENLFTGLRQ